MAADRKYNIELTGANPGDQIPVSVLNASGAPAFETIFTADQNGRIKAKVDLGALSSGLYIVRINATRGLWLKILLQ